MSLKISGCEGKTVMSYDKLVKQIDSLYNEMISKIKKEFASTDYVAMTADLWSKGSKVRLLIVI